MKPPLNKIVDAFIRQVQDHPDTAPSPGSLKRWLLRAGYSKGDIDAAMKLVDHQMSLARPQTHRGPGSIRHLLPFEEHKLSLEARDALARLEIYMLIEPWEREMILEQAMHHDGEVSMDDLEYILQNTLYTARDVETQQTIEAVFSGVTDTLH